MGLLRSLAMLFVLMWFFHLPCISARSSAQDLDVLLQDYAYRAFVRPKTGVKYDGKVPANLTGINVSAMRLRSGSFYKRGAQINEFQISKGVSVAPYVERLVFVYQNLGNWTTVYYPLPPGYTYLTPVLGLLAYDASNLSATNLPELTISTEDPILINFVDAKTASDGSAAKCVMFGIHGSVTFSNVTSANICSTAGQGHFSLVIESIAPSPAPVSLTPSLVPSPGPAIKEKNTSRVWIIVGSVLGGLVLLVLLMLLVLWLMKYKRKQKMQHMERTAEVGEALRMTSVGSTKAPSATVTRTQPTLENEYVP